METLNSTANEAVTAPVAAAPVEIPAPVETPAPAVTPAPTVAAAPAPVPAPAVTPASAPVPGVKMELPKTTGKTPGGWNRFAGYNPAEAKNKKDNRRGDSSKGRR